MKKVRKHILLVTLLFGIFMSGFGQNPIIQTMYTADPAPIVHNDTLFLYVGHDEDNAPNNTFLMREYSLFTTTDMVNWTAHKAPLKTSDFKWSGGDASAAQCIERDGKFYFYISSWNTEKPGIAMGVAVSDSPYGPFKDALGKSLVTNDMTKFADHSWDDLDPSVMIDDNGQAYLFWGNNALYYAKIKKNMVELDSEITALDIFNKEAFGPDFEEAPWVYRRDDRYYMIYASHVIEDIRYTTSENIKGPWEFGGLLMKHSGNSGSNHPAIIDYKGNSYFFYHTAKLEGGHDHRRSVSVEKFEYNEDGSIPEIPKTDEGLLESVGNLNPFQLTQAETIAWSEGLKLDHSEEVGVFVTDIHNEDLLKVRDVDFGNSGAAEFTAKVSSRYLGGEMEIRLDSKDGPLLGTLNVPYIGDWSNWKNLSVEIEKVTGIHDLYFLFKGREPHELFRFDSWKFSE